jgi:hypothetical protein
MVRLKSNQKHVQTTPVPATRKVAAWYQLAGKADAWGGRLLFCQDSGLTC